MSNLVRCLVLLGCVALYRAKVAYGHRTFPPTICWFVCLSLSLSVYLVYGGKMADRIGYECGFG